MTNSSGRTAAMTGTRSGLHRHELPVTTAWAHGQAGAARTGRFSIKKHEFVAFNIWILYGGLERERISPKGAQRKHVQQSRGARRAHLPR
ncbi:unnamed protein product, partial [Ectocarpus sp. 4 AP-2014]